MEKKNEKSNSKGKTIKKVKTIKKGTQKKVKPRKKKGFTLIELLAVIIIFGILMIIAIPSVTKYINDSRKSSYINTAKEIISGARNYVNEGKLGMYDTDTTYYIDYECIKTENAAKSPYGDFTKAYVVVTYNGNGYEYYWTSVDETGQGISRVLRLDKLNEDYIESDLKDTDIVNSYGIDGRSKYVIIDKDTTNCGSGTASTSKGRINGETGEIYIPVCKKATSLHKVICNNNNSCGLSVGYGNEIVFGSLVNGTPKPGDAYDCDVNNDKNYDPENERFYFIKNEGENYVLIYSKNMNDQTNYAYDLSNENWHGPTEGYKYLPNKSDWSNPGLIQPKKRIIKSQSGRDHSLGPVEFSYGDKVARFITFKEITDICGSSNVSSLGYLDNFVFFMDGIGEYYNVRGRETNGYWLETFGMANNTANFVNGSNRYVSRSDANNATTRGVRPVITIKTSDLEQ